MKLSLKGQSVTIDGRTFSGQSIQINGDQVVVDGVVQQGSLVGPITVTVNGDCESVENGNGDVTVTGSAGSVRTSTGGVRCAAVSGDVTTSVGNVNCGDVGGSVRTSVGNISYRKA